MNERIRRRRLVHPRLVQVFCELAVGNDKFELHNRRDVVVYAHNDGIRAVRIL